jgi:FAD synthase
VRFLREEKQFDSLEQVKEQIKDDVDSILRQGAH